MSNESQFKVGDIVEAFGHEGVITYINSSGDISLSIKVELKTEQGIQEQIFTKDGKKAFWHKTPSLKLIKRPKKKVTRVANAWINIYPCGDYTVYRTKAIADSNALSNRIKCIELTGEYEIEVDEE